MIGEYVNKGLRIMYIRCVFSSVLRHNNRKDDLLLCRQHEYYALSIIDKIVPDDEQNYADSIHLH